MSACHYIWTKSWCVCGDLDKDLESVWELFGGSDISTCSPDAPGLEFIKIGSALSLRASFTQGGMSSIMDFMALGSTISLRSSMKFADNMSLLQFMTLSSTLSLRQYARFGSSISLLRNAHAATTVSVLGFTMLGSSLSMRSSARPGSNISLLTFTAFGSALSLRGYARSGSQLSLLGSFLLGGGKDPNRGASVVDFFMVGSTLSVRCGQRLHLGSQGCSVLQFVRLSSYANGFSVISTVWE